MTTCVNMYTGCNPQVSWWQLLDAAGIQVIQVADVLCWLSHLIRVNLCGVMVHAAALLQQGAEMYWPTDCTRLCAVGLDFQGQATLNWKQSTTACIVYVCISALNPAILTESHVFDVCKAAAYKTYRLTG